MFKKMLGISALSVAVLTAMTANATTATSETPEITSKNAVNISDVSSVSPLSTAIKSGIYVTGQLGYANTGMKAKTTPSNPNPFLPIGTNLDNNGLAGRIALGYQFNQNIALELGYLQLQNGKTHQVGQGFPTGDETLKQNALDVAVKGIYPLSDRFNVYGKLGVAYLTSDISFHGTASDGRSYNDNPSFDISKRKFAPEVAIGASYNVTPNMFVDASITHIQPMGKNRPGNIDFAAVGIGYMFG